MAPRIKPMKYGEIEILSIQPHGEEGVYFKIRYPYHIDAYRTSRNGKGLWMLKLINGHHHWLQVKRISQFTLKNGPNVQKQILTYITGDKFRRPVQDPEQLTLYDFISKTEEALNALI